SSATMTSPGLTSAPAQTTGTLTEPSVDFTVPLALIARANTGNFISVSSRTSRTPPSITSARHPRARNDVASSSPQKPSSESALQAATITSPFCSCLTTTCSIQLSPGCSSTVTAVPQTCAPG